MPAVLRPNEFPSGAPVAKSSPTCDEVDDDERAVRSSGSFTSLSGILSLSRLSRRSTGDSDKLVDWNWDLSNYAPVNGEPTRRHWKVRLKLPSFYAMRRGAKHTGTTSTSISRHTKAVSRGSEHGTTMSRSFGVASTHRSPAPSPTPPSFRHPRELQTNTTPSPQADVESEVCDDPTCKKYFNYFVRRHHCRRCGNIFCDPHSMQIVPLDESANFNPRGHPVRACNHCFLEFKAWRSRSNSPASSLAGGGGGSGSHTPQPHGGSRTMPASPISASPLSGASPTTPGKTQPEVAISVPSDWNWSTF